MRLPPVGSRSAPALLLALAVGWAVACTGGGSPDPAAPEAAPPSPNAVTLSDAEQAETGIRTIAVEERVVTSVVSLPGRIRPDANQEAYATSLVSGRVETLRVGVGQAVRKGQVLAEVASPELSDRVEALQAARDDLDRQQRLAARGVAVQKNLRAAERAWQAARQQFLSIGVAPDRIDRVANGNEPMRTFPLVSPMDGVVLERRAVLGDPVQPGDRLFYVVDLQPIRVVADVFERSLGQIREGQRVTVTTPTDPDRVYESTIAQLVPRIDEDRRAATARVMVPNEDGALQPGMFATVRVEVPGPRQPALPAEVLMTDGEGAYVVVAEGEGRFRQIVLEAEAGADGYVAVPSLAPGTQVVRDGAFQIVSAMKQRTGS